MWLMVWPVVWHLVKAEGLRSWSPYDLKKSITSSFVDYSLITIVEMLDSDIAFFRIKFLVEYDFSEYWSVHFMPCTSQNFVVFGEGRGVLLHPREMARVSCPSETVASSPPNMTWVQYSLWNQCNPPCEVCRIFTNNNNNNFLNLWSSDS